MCAIRIGNDPVQTIGRLAKKAGEVEASQVEAQRAEERYARAQQMDFQREMAEFNANLQKESQKMALQQSAQEAVLSRQHDFALKEWEKEVEFKKDATDRVRKQDEFELIKKQINDNGNITPEEKKDMIKRATAQFFGYDSSDIYGRKQGELELLQIDQARMEMGLPPKYMEAPQPQTQPLTQPTQEGSENKIKVISPEGNVGFVPASEWPQYRDEKKFELYNVNTELGDPIYQQWKQGYEQQQAIRESNTTILKKVKAKNKQDKMTITEPLAWKRYMEEIKANLQKDNQ